MYGNAGGLRHRNYRGIRAFFFFSNFWQLAFKGTPWLVLFCSFVHQALKGSPEWGLYCQVHQTLKRPPFLGSFSISQLLVPGCAERGHSDVSTSCVWLSSTTLLPWLPSFPPKVFPVMITSLTVPQALSPQSTGDFTLELLSNPYATALGCLEFQETYISVQGT